MPPSPPMSMKTIVATPSAARYENATLTIRYSGATALRSTSASRSPIAMIATGTIDPQVVVGGAG